MLSCLFIWHIVHPSDPLSTHLTHCPLPDPFTPMWPIFMHLIVNLSDLLLAHLVHFPPLWPITHPPDPLTTHLTYWFHPSYPFSTHLTHCSMPDPFSTHLTHFSPVWPIVHPSNPFSTVQRFSTHLTHFSPITHIVECPTHCPYVVHLSDPCLSSRLMGKTPFFT